MNLTEVLRVSFHLSTLYDQQREPGGESSWKISYSSKKEKELSFPTNNAGWQVALLGEILVALSDYEWKNPGAAITTKSLYRTIRPKFKIPITESDVISVLSSVSSNEIRLCDFQKGEIAQNTALVVYSGQTKTTQLTALGRSLIRIEETKDDWLSADLDAGKIIKNIQMGRFDVALQYCRSLESMIQDEKFKVQGILEQPHLEEKKNEYSNIRDAYQNTVSSIQNAVMDTFGLMASEKVKKDISVWISQENGDPFIEKKINQSIERLRKSLDVLDSLFAKVVDELAADFSERIVPIPNFALALKYFVDQDMPLSQVDSLFSLYGKWKVNLSCGSLSDIIVPLPALTTTEEAPEVGMLKEKEKGQVLRRLIDDYRNRHKKEFQAILEKEIPFKLSHILKAQNFGTDDVANIYHFLSTSLNISTIGAKDYLLYTSLDEFLSEYEFPESNQKIWISDLTFTPRKNSGKEAAE